ncbi:cation-transporting P-type ATPase [Candidatus Saccharibacteria bacterium]|nr:cation-transporting P-type ATPase [Candidatus Saccharibacteria bacterium]
MQVWHSLNLEELYASLNSGQHGLSTTEANLRLNQYGFNELEADGQPLWRKIIEPFASLFVIILVLATAISFLSHKSLDGIVISAIIAVNIAIYYTQQQATNRVLKSLKKHAQQYVQVLRDGRSTTVAANLLVPGDIVLLFEGQRVPADARVIHEENLLADEAVLTGESLPVKKVVSTISADKPLYERENMLFSGTYIAAGNGRAMVIATGSATEFGAIAKLAVQAEPKSPMQQKIDTLVGRLIKVLGVVAAVVFTLSLLRDVPANEALRFVLAMSVSAVPEDLPIALSVVAVLGIRRMARKNALVRSMRTIEDLGLITAIATDKTGTLTKNSLAVADNWPADPRIDLKRIALKTLGQPANVTEPFDRALQKFAGDHMYNGKLIKNYPFDQALRMSGALWQEADAKVLYVKGAPEHLLNLCQLDDETRHQAESRLHHMVANGQRVIAVAWAKVDHAADKLAGLKDLPLQFAGFVAFADELRPESAAAIAAAKSAGISVRMITGDHFETAFHVGKNLGISTHRDQVIMGSDLPETEEQLETVLKTKSVFARILPQQKFNILRALKRSEITAMTGDGVNDVPALTNAHVGIAMGSGNDIAKDAGDMILLDSSFASIVQAISEGRIIYDNIRRMMFYLLATSLGEILTMIGALLIGLPLPVTAIMILWVNLVTDTALVIPLGLEPAEDDHMKRPPRRPRAPILDRVILSRIVIVGAAMSIPILIVFDFLIQSGYSLEYAQTIAFFMLVVSQWTNAFNARSEQHSAIRGGQVMNYKLLFGLFMAALLQSLVMFGPLKEVFGVASVGFDHLLVGSIFVILTVLLAVEIHKLHHKFKS